MFLASSSKQLFSLAKQPLLRYISSMEVSFKLQDGGEIAGQAWGSPDNVPVVGLHGWLDNSSSFAYLGRRLRNQ